MENILWLYIYNTTALSQDYKITNFRLYNHQPGKLYSIALSFTISCFLKQYPVQKPASLRLRLYFTTYGLLTLFKSMLQLTSTKYCGFAIAMVFTIAIPVC